jgi:hypothetical protein
MTKMAAKVDILKSIIYVHFAEIPETKKKKKSIRFKSRTSNKSERTGSVYGPRPKLKIEFERN